MVRLTGTKLTSIIITNDTTSSTTVLTIIMEIIDLENKKESGEVDDDHGGERNKPAPQEHETPKGNISSLHRHNQIRN